MRAVIVAAVAAVCGTSTSADWRSEPVRPQSADTVRYRIAASIDEELEPRAAELGEVFGLAVDKVGDVYVADISNAIIVVFGRDGKFRGTVGRKGRGPGEFQAPTGIAIDNRNDRLWVRDLEHVTRFVRDPRTGLLAKYDSAFRQPTFHAWRSSRASRVGTDASFLHVAPDATAGGPKYFFRYAPNGTRLDSIPLPTYANNVRSAWYPTGKSGGRMLPGLNRVPFAPVPQWDITPQSNVVSGDAIQYRIVETGRRGEPVREFGRPYGADPIPRAERAESLRALTRRLDSVRVPFHLVQGMPDDVRQKRLPSTFPAFQAIFAEVDNRVWVRRWPNEGQMGQTIFDVFDSERRYVQTVSLPLPISNEPTPVLRAEFVVAVVNVAETGAQHIVRFETARGR